MSKIICEVCGTTYPEVSTQCPICGCVRPADAQAVAADMNERTSAGKYQHVKGGRFSKANVRKRNRANQAGAYSQPATVSAGQKKKKKQADSNKGLVITILVLLLAIIAVIAYIILKFFMPIPDTKEPANVTTTEPSQVVTEEPTEPDLTCTDILLESDEIVLEEVGTYHQLIVTTMPADTTDEIIYESADKSIAMVDADGLITSVSKGETTITVTCGTMVVQCKVTVGTPKEEFRLNRQDITFENAGETWIVYSGNISNGEIKWTSDDETVATVENGKVTAVGGGMTTIYGDYNGTSASCVIRCEFTDDTQDDGHEGNGNVSSDSDADETEPENTTAASGNYKAPFRLKNLIGVSADDVSIRVGESFILALVDSNGDQIDGVEWTVDGSSCTVSDGTVKGVGYGTCEIVASYEGETYTCIVRVG